MSNVTGGSNPGMPLSGTAAHLTCNHCGHPIYAGIPHPCHFAVGGNQFFPGAWSETALRTIIREEIERAMKEQPHDTP